jgi:hypothetical protein
MSRKNSTWFGFNITQKQSVQIFILSIIGLFFSTFLLSMMLYSLVSMIIYYDPYYYTPDDNYIIRMVFSILPYLLVFSMIFILSLYSLIKCRKIAKYYSPLIDPVVEPKLKSSYSEVRPNSIAQFCSNCGKIKKGHEKFCPNCGQYL